ncbi:MAG: hypothetical protein HUU37_10585 [Bdellovibrionales bacterium]|nr:hypothetical protein [Bdellovibrionales bacterium]
MTVTFFKRMLAVGMAVFWVLFAYSFVGHAQEIPCRPEHTLCRVNSAP